MPTASKLEISGGTIPTISLPRYNCQSESGVLNNSSIVPRSFSPTKDSSAPSREIVKGKKPMISTENGTRRSTIRLPPYWLANRTASPANAFIRNGKPTVRIRRGERMRQSRNWSRSSRLLINQTGRRESFIRILPDLGAGRRGLGVCHNLEINLLQAARRFLYGHYRRL